MRREFRVLLGIAILVAVCISAMAAWAQERQAPPDKAQIERQAAQGPEGPPPPIHDRMIFERHLQGPDGPTPPPGGPGDFIFLATEMSFGGKVVKGAPYSAQAVTESTQTLSDGNRIINKSTASIYRDSEGRTRREQTLRAIGPFANSAEPPQTVFINDPVAGTSYTLDVQNRIARKMKPMTFKMPAPPPPPEGEKVENPEGAPMHERIPAHPDVLMLKRGLEGAVAFGIIGPANHNARTESLRKQSIEGVEAEGTRTIVTIAAGEIGNERPIEIVSERWYSAELQTVVMTRHSDPRFGENSYRLTNISRSEPARTLFEVPGDFAIKEAPLTPEPMRMRMKKPAGPE